MDETRLDRLETKLDKITESVASIDKTLAGQHISLVEHIRRTGLLEEAVEPIKKHVAMTNGVLKFIGIIGVLLGIVAAIKSLL